MKELGLDPKQYKFHSADDKSVTLQHKKGHTVKIALNVLSKKNQDILKALQAVNSNEGTQNPKPMAKGGKVPGQPGYAEADEYYQQNNERNYAANAGLPCLNPNCKSHGIPHPNCRCYSGGESFAKGGKVSKSHFCSESREHQPGCEYAKGGGISMQGMDIRHGNETKDPDKKAMAKDLARKEASGRAEEERYVKPKMKGLAEGGQPEDAPNNGGNPAIDTIVPDTGYGKIIIMKKADGGEVKYQRVEHEQGSAAEARQRKGFWESEHGKQALNAQNKEVKKIQQAPIKKAEGGPLNESWNKDKPAAQDSAGNMMPSEQCFDDGGMVDGVEKWIGGTFGTTPEPDKGIPGPIFHDEGNPDRKPKQQPQPQQKANGGQICQSCGQPNRKMYAAPDALVSDDDSTPQQNDITQLPQEYIPEDPKTKSGREEKEATIKSMESGKFDQDQAAAQQSQNVVSAPQDTQPPQASVDMSQDPGQDQSGDQAQSDPTMQTQYNPQQMQNVAPADYQKGVQQELLNETNAFHQDLVNGHIGPKTMHDLMWKDEKGNDKSTLGKIGTIFGMLLAGAGSGLSHQPNALLALMQKQIDNDLDAQKTSKTNAINYLRMNQQNEMNKANIRLTNANANNMNLEANQKAYGLARMQMNRAALKKLTDDVSNLPPGSPNRQKAEAALPLLFQSINNADYDISSRAAAAATMARGQQQAANGNEGAYQGQQNALRWGGMGQMADVNDQRHIPGIQGQASGPVDQNIRQELYNMNVLDAKGKDLLNFAKQHAGTWNPQTRSQAEQKLEELKNFYNGSIRGGALTEGRLKWYDEQFKKSPTDIIPQLMGSTKRLEEVVNSNQMRRDQQLGLLGFPKQKPMNQGQPVIKTMGGVQFQQVPGGWQRVK